MSATDNEPIDIRTGKPVGKEQLCGEAVHDDTGRFLGICCGKWGHSRTHMQVIMNGQYYEDPV